MTHLLTSHVKLSWFV